jgi:hypothetical protein
MFKNRLAVQKMCWWVFVSQLCAKNGHQNLPLGRVSIHTGKGGIVSLHSLQTYMGSRGIGPLILGFSSRWRWVVNFFTSTALSLAKKPGTHWIGGWVGPWCAVRKWMRGFKWPVGKAIPPVNVGTEISVYCLPNETGPVTWFYGGEVGVGMWCWATAGSEADGACSL